MTLFVGIDVSKYKHDLAILDEHREILNKHFQFANTYLGFQRLKELIDMIRIQIIQINNVQDQFNNLMTEID